MKTYIELNKNTILIEGTSIPKDPANSHYQQFLEEQKNGEAELVPFVPPSLTWDDIRIQRNFLLKESDWSTAPDATPKPNKEAWLTYRQALRDITTSNPVPEAVVWPQKPA